MDRSKLHSAQCPACDGVGSTTNVLMLPEKVHSGVLVPHEEVMPCHRCDATGAVFVCPSCDTEFDMGSTTPNRCAYCGLHFDED